MSESNIASAIEHRHFDRGRATDGLSAQARRHYEMRREALKRHPQIRELIGSDPKPALAIPLLMSLHWGTAWLVQDASLLILFLVAFCWGQVVLHSAGTLLHESAHRSVFRWPLSKLGLDLGLEMILASFGRALTYQHEHMSSHHPHLGNYERDYEHEDVCRYLARHSYLSQHPTMGRLATLAELLINLLPLGFLIAGELVPRFYRLVTGRTVKDPKRNIASTKPALWQKWLFIGASLAVCVGLCTIFGFAGLLYHVWSLSIFLGKCGVTNLGQSLSEHPDGDPINPTQSTYWWGNKALFNAGYHNEHHTFPNIPCTRLPQLKTIAPEIFHTAAEKSYVGLWWEYITNDFSPTRQNEVMYRDNTERCGG